MAKNVEANRGRKAKLELWAKKELNVLFIGPAGVGKCLAKGTPVLLFDGRIIPVELVKVGDVLMGPDSTPRKVLSICHGQDNMYKVIPTKGDPFTCNEPHVLTLKMTGTDDAFDIPLNEFLKKGSQFRKEAKLFRTGVNFQNKKPLPEPPYMVGVWLGDASSGSIFTATEEEILGYLCDYANANQMTLKPRSQPQEDQDGSNIDYLLLSGIHAGKGLPRSGRNKFLTFLKKFKLIGNKHIPLEYLTASEEDRLQLLAGLIDTDGYMFHNCFEITQKSQLLAQDIAFLARSLGFAAYIKPCRKSCMYKGVRRWGNYYRVSISGSIDKVPCQLVRKQGKPRQQKKDVLKTGIKKIEPLGKDEYYGFTLDGDGRFLLGDFTVTHNTSLVQQTFNDLGYKWRYFSAATMDPWVDFVGVPKESTNGDASSESFDIIRKLLEIDQNLALEWVANNWKLEDASAKKVIDHLVNNPKHNSYLKMIRPKDFADGTVEALFFDEFNRAPKKIRNAVMELLQFKSINGERFPNLKIIWAAINPEATEEGADEEEYDVEKLDPAQKDRFHIHITIPREPNAEWFAERYGERTAKVAIEWWKDLPEKEKSYVSPRRLQYALDVGVTNSLDMRDVLPGFANTGKLVTALKNGPTEDRLAQFMKDKNVGEARIFLSNDNCRNAAMRIISGSTAMMEFFLPLLRKELISSEFAAGKETSDFILENSVKVPVFNSVLKDIIKAGTDKKSVKKIKDHMQGNAEFAKAFSAGSDDKPDAPFFNAKGTTAAYRTELSSLKNWSCRSVQDKMAVYSRIEANVPDNLSADDALNTLILLNKSVGTLDGSTLSSAPLQNLVPIINHCIEQMSGKLVKNWNDILLEYGHRFNELFDKLQSAGLLGRVLKPEIQGAA